MKFGPMTIAPLLAAAILAPACGTEDDLAPPAESPTDTEAEESESGPTAEATEQTDPEVDETPPPRCEVPEFEDDSPDVTFEELTAAVVDENGDGISGVLAQACGMNVCLVGWTDDTGYVLNRPDEPETIRRAAFKYGDGLVYAQFAYLLPEQAVHELGEQPTQTLPNVSGGDAFEPGTSVTSSGVTLNLAANSEVSIDRLTFPEESQHRFVAARMSEDTWPSAVTSHDLNLGMLFVLGPLKTEFCPAAKLSVPNAAGWDPGERVEFLLHITDVGNHWGVYGEWAVVATGQVSSDGDEITTDDSSGIPQLGAIGLRISDG